MNYLPARWRGSVRWCVAWCVTWRAAGGCAWKCTESSLLNSWSYGRDYEETYGEGNPPLPQ